MAIWLTAIPWLYCTSFETNPSLSLSIVLKILSMWFSSPRNSSNDNFPSRFLSRILKNPSTSRLNWITWWLFYHFHFAAFSLSLSLSLLKYYFLTNPGKSIQISKYNNRKLLWLKDGVLYVLKLWFIIIIIFYWLRPSSKLYVQYLDLIND